MSNFALRCGRLDMHGAHEWTRPRELGRRRPAYWCNGAPVTEMERTRFDAADDAAEERAARERREM